MNASQDFGEKDHVRMHDVIRDVAIVIDSKEKHGFLQKRGVSSTVLSRKDTFHNCNWLSIDSSIEDNTKHTLLSDFPNLRLLMISSSSTRHQVFDASPKDFGEMEELNVLSLSGEMGELNVLSLSGINLGSLPPTLELLTNLRTLSLHKCLVEDISAIGKLVNLEILCIQECWNIVEIPANIGRLNHLRFLELNDCSHLKRIEAGVLSSLVGLEELKIYCNNIKWEEETNASLSELECLPSLTSLDICTYCSNLIGQDMNLPKKLERYHIYFVMPRRSHEKHTERTIALDLPRDVIAGNWIYQLLRSTQALRLSGDGLNNFNLTAGTGSLKRLEITYCSTVKRLVNGSFIFIPALERLDLRRLNELESIVDGTIPEGFNSFKKLKSLLIESLPKLIYLWKSLNQNILLGHLISMEITICQNLRYLFSLETARSLVQLQHLEIRDCYSIEQVFWHEVGSNRDASIIIELPKLRELILARLPKLAAFSQGTEIMELPQLTKLQVTYCPELRTRFGKSPNLETLYLTQFKSSNCFHSSCCVRQLRYVSIMNSDELEEIFGDEIGEDEDRRHIVFPTLTQLELTHLPCLTTFYKGVEIIKFPKLQEMDLIGDLGRLNGLLARDSEATHDHNCVYFLCHKKVEYPSLKSLQIRDLPDTVNNLWCHHVQLNFFHNLGRLCLCEVNGVANLMSSSIAKNLVNLFDLSIEWCNQMTVVIEDKKEEPVIYIFPKLTFMVIGYLPKLIIFCNGNNAFELPSLLQVKIYGCPKMETFTLGSVRAPNLSTIMIRSKHVKRRGLNEAIRNEFAMPQINDDDNDSDDDDYDYDYDDEDEDEDEDEKKDE